MKIYEEYEARQEGKQSAESRVQQSTKHETLHYVKTKNILVHIITKVMTNKKHESYVIQLNYKRVKLKKSRTLERNYRD